MLVPTEAPPLYLLVIYSGRYWLSVALIYIIALPHLGFVKRARIFLSLLLGNLSIMNRNKNKNARCVCTGVTYVEPKIKNLE